MPAAATQRAPKLGTEAVPDTEEAYGVDEEPAPEPDAAELAEDADVKDPLIRAVAPAKGKRKARAPPRAT